MDTDGFIKELERKVENATKELRSINAKLQEYTEKQRNRTEILDAARKLLADARGTSVSVEKEQAQHLEVEGINKTDFIREIVKRNQDHGISAADIFRAFKVAGIRLHRNYIYSVLNRLVERGEIERRERKVFPVDKGTGSEQY